MTRHLYVQGILAGNGARSSSTALQVITPLGGTHYLGDKNRFDVSSKGPSSGIRIIHTNSRRRAFARNVESVFIAGHVACEYRASHDEQQKSFKPFWLLVVRRSVFTGYSHTPIHANHF